MLQSAGGIGRTAARDWADGDGHAGEGAEAALVVGEVDLPQPGRAALVPAARLGVDRSARDRAKEAGLVGHADRDVALRVDGAEGRLGRHALGHRGVDTAVDYAHRLEYGLVVGGHR